MSTEKQIEELAYAIWDREGRPGGKDKEHYFRAKQFLGNQETDEAANDVSAASSRATLSGLSSQLRLMKQESQNQFRGSMLVWGVGIGVAYLLWGLSVWAVSFLSVEWQRIEAPAFILMGIALMLYCKRRLLRNLPSK